MPVVVTITGKPFEETKFSSVDLMREIGLLARERIVRRTLAGLDQDEAAFAPYSLGYAMQKGLELGSAGVNLQVSGAMLNSIQITDVTENSVSLGFV